MLTCPSLWTLNLMGESEDVGYGHQTSTRPSLWNLNLMVPRKASGVTWPQGLYDQKELSQCHEFVYSSFVAESYTPSELQNRCLISKLFLRGKFKKSYGARSGNKLVVEVWNVKF
ncbi:hypothetical protein AVEN_76907-1 [Araneus ventricosus]|uniref:Uncharacterized protein n=1 Tax=Araneus ventricosus TaxID=182803 RepID=A0A4Y2TL22_ARAVE|nr:hypothetical protein AVEN_76907-1 [Araneus ventricosus]